MSCSLTYRAVVEGSKSYFSDDSLTTLKTGNRGEEGLHLLWHKLAGLLKY